ncbi:MAG TPA: hypothetical protein PK869_09535 [Candidatus Hydrogenedentes bacterium]|nr:hypothetical protein [Candidatus Hydrogenedentota bacterium]
MPSSEELGDEINARMENRYDNARSCVVDEFNDVMDGLGDRFDDRLPDDLPRLPHYDDDGE